MVLEVGTEAEHGCGGDWHVHGPPIWSGVRDLSGSVSNMCVTLNKELMYFVSQFICPQDLFLVWLLRAEEIMYLSLTLNKMPEGLLRWLRGKETACDAEDAGDPGSITGLGRSPEGGHGNPLQYSCLENPMDRRAWQAAVHGVSRVKHDLMTIPPPPWSTKRHDQLMFLLLFLKNFKEYAIWDITYLRLNST